MLRVEKLKAFGLEAALRGMRNPKASWERSDSYWSLGRYDGEECYVIGKSDLALARKLIKAGAEHRKFMRMCHIQMDVTAPMYWWKEFDTYKVGTVSNSCSTMNSLMEKPFSVDDFSIDTQLQWELMPGIIDELNRLRKKWYQVLNDSADQKEVWKTVVGILPMSYLQKRTIDLSFETALIIIKQRSCHKLTEWRDFSNILSNIPYLKELIEVPVEE